jgi:plasmid stabilization system protein ParE
MKLLLRINPMAHNDVAAIRDYIKKDNPTAANRTAKRIYKAFDDLADSLLIGGSLQKRYEIQTDYMFCILKPYFVFYKIDGEFLNVYRVLDGRSDYLVTLDLKEPQAIAEEDD